MWRLHFLRAFALLFVVTGFFSVPRMLFESNLTNRGMIAGFLSSLWVMSFFALRYPLKMLPIFLFEFAWKAIWLLAFGLPQWFTGMGSPRLSQDLLEIGAPPHFDRAHHPVGLCVAALHRRAVRALALTGGG
jgi:hypothetical protein